MIHRFIVSVCFLIMGFSCMPLHIASAEPLLVLTSPLPVFSIQKDNGEMTGYSVEYAKSVLKFANLEASVKPLPFARLMKQAASGDLMLATGVVRTPQREDDFFWLAPITANVIGIYGTKPIDIMAPSTPSQSITVAVLRGDYRAEIGKQYPSLKMIEYNSWEQAIGAALLGRVDAVFFSGLGVALTCKNANLKCDRMTKQYSHDVLFSYMVMPKTEQNRAVAAKISNAVSRFVKTPYFNDLTEQWLPELKSISPSVDVAEGVIMLGEVDEDISSKSPLWVITNPEPLFSERNERGELTGYAVDLVRSILVEAGIQTEILSAPWQRILVESEMKSDVLVFALARTEEREHNFHWITPITENAYSVFKRSGTPISANNINELPNQSRIAVLKGDFREAIIKDSGHIPVARENWPSTVQLFLEGDADFLFFSDGGIDVICELLQEPCNKVEKVFTYQLATTYLAISKKGTSTTVVEKISKAAQAFKESEQFNNLVNQWLNDYAQRTSLSMHEKHGKLRLWKEEQSSR